MQTIENNNNTSNNNTFERDSSPAEVEHIADKKYPLEVLGNQGAKQGETIHETLILALKYLLSSIIFQLQKLLMVRGPKTTLRKEEMITSGGGFFQGGGLQGGQKQDSFGSREQQ